jgi:hypothetical protein
VCDLFVVRNDRLKFHSGAPFIYFIIEFIFVVLRNHKKLSLDTIFPFPVSPLSLCIVGSSGRADGL